MASIFSKIIAGQIPCYKVYEDDLVLAFLDIRPIQLGHTLVVSKMEIDQWIDLPENVHLRVHQIAQKIARAIKIVTQCQRVGTMIQGFEVPHFHYHLVPMYDPSDLSFSKAKSRSEQDNLKMTQSIISAIKLN